MSLPSAVPGTFMMNLWRQPVKSREAKNCLTFSPVIPRHWPLSGIQESWTGKSILVKKSCKTMFRPFLKRVWTVPFTGFLLPNPPIFSMSMTPSLSPSAGKRAYPMPISLLWKEFFVHPLVIMNGPAVNPSLCMMTGCTMLYSTRSRWGSLFSRKRISAGIIRLC